MASKNKSQKKPCDKMKNKISYDKIIFIYQIRLDFINSSMTKVYHLLIDFVRADNIKLLYSILFRIKYAILIYANFFFLPIFR